MYNKIFCNNCNKLIKELPYFLTTICFGDKLVLVGAPNVMWSIDFINLI